MKKAILLVSFGSSYLDTLKNSIEVLEKSVAKEFPERRFYRAFTSGFIIRKLKRTYGMEIDTVQEALEGMLADGMSDVIIQPTHIINGQETDTLAAIVENYRERFEKISLGNPLMTSLADCQQIAEIIASRIDEKCDDCLHIFMGHGTAHYANAAYSQLGWILCDLNREDVMIATVEGYPSLETIKKRLEKLNGIKKINLYPLLIVAGDHAKNDLAGDTPDSWKSQLSALGYEVNCKLEGIGEWKEIQKMFAEHAKAVSE